MSDNTGIEWTDATWNPVTGCTKVSPGCDHCYAETFAERFRGVAGHHFEHGFDVQLRPERLDVPLRWRRPRKVFVNSMSDLFHQDVPDDYIARVFAIMSLAPQHTFQVLTKRHARMRSLLNSPRWDKLLDDAWCDLPDITGRYAPEDALHPADNFPAPNVWGGVSVEDQARAQLRIDALCATPFAVRFLSCEPLLGPVKVAPYLTRLHDCNTCDGTGSVHVPGGGMQCPDCLYDAKHGRLEGVDWVIVGGESGPGARPMHPDWARSLRDQCLAAGVPFHFKQWGEWAPPWTTPIPDRARVHRFEDGRLVIRAGRKRAGREIDGRTWTEYPRIDQLRGEPA